MLNGLLHNGQILLVLDSCEPVNRGLCASGTAVVNAS
jgi:hypothetical protein